jgi:hypothetical protein
MDKSFDEWARAEISRLRAEADGLQRALDKFLESKPRERREPATVTLVRKPRRVPNKARRGSKRGFVLKQIAESGRQGMTTEELFGTVQEAFPDMKRSSLRALLYLEKKEGHIVQRATGRYLSPEFQRVRLEEGSGVSAPDPSGSSEGAA